MNHRHFHQRIKVGEALIIDEFCQVAQKTTDFIMVLGRRVDRGAGLFVFKFGAGQFADAGIILLQILINFEDMVDGEQTTLSYLRKAFLEGTGIVANLLSCRTFDEVREQLRLIEIVMGGDDIFNLRTVLGLL